MRGYSSYCTPTTKDPWWTSFLIYNLVIVYPLSKVYWSIASIINAQVSEDDNGRMNDRRCIIIDIIYTWALHITFRINIPQIHRFIIDITSTKHETSRKNTWEKIQMLKAIVSPVPIHGTLKNKKNKTLDVEGSSCHCHLWLYTNTRVQKNTVQSSNCILKW